MIMIEKNIRLHPPLAGVIVVMAFLVGCAPGLGLPSEIIQGSSKDEVITVYGDPDQVQIFILPEVPFFGPQESLINLVPSGTLIEEWVFEIGDEELFIWFTGEGAEPDEDWLVLDFGRYPKGTVY